MEAMRTVYAKTGSQFQRVSNKTWGERSRVVRAYRGRKAHIRFFKNPIGKGSSWSASFDSLFLFVCTHFRLFVRQIIVNLRTACASSQKRARPLRIYQQIVRGRHDDCHEHPFTLSHAPLRNWFGPSSPLIWPMTGTRSYLAQLLGRGGLWCRCLSRCACKKQMHSGEKAVSRKDDTTSGKTTDGFGSRTSIGSHSFGVVASNAHALTCFPFALFVETIYNSYFRFRWEPFDTISVWVEFHRHSSARNSRDEIHVETAYLHVSSISIGLTFNQGEFELWKTGTNITL